MLESIGQAVVLFCFNELVANALVFATKGNGFGQHGLIWFCLPSRPRATIAPWIASYGSSGSMASLAAVPRTLAEVLATTLSQAGLWAEAYLVTGLVLDAIYRKAPSQASVVSHPFQGIKKGIVFSGTFMGVLYTFGLLWRTPGLGEIAADYPLAATTLAGALVFPLAKTIVESFDGSTAFFRRIVKSYSNPVLYLRGAIVGLGLGYATVLSLWQSELSTRVWFGFGVGVLAYAGVDLVRDLVYGVKKQGRVRARACIPRSRTARRLHRSRAGLLLRCCPGCRGDRQAGALPWRRAPRRCRSVFIPSSANGALSTWAR